MTKVVAVFNRDDSVSWCYCNKGDIKTIGNVLILRYNDYDAAKVLVKNNIEEFKSGGYIKVIPLESQVPFRSKTEMLNALKDDVTYFLIYDEIDGWIITANNKKKSLASYLSRKENKEF